MSEPFGVRASKIWVWDPDAESYGTGINLSLNAISFDPQHDTDTLRALGAVEDTLSVLTQIDGTLTPKALDWSALAAMIGSDDSSSGSETHQNDDYAGEDLPYFGLGCEIPLKNGKVAHVYLPKMQLQKTYPLELTEENQFAMPGLDFTAMRLRLADGTTYPVRKHFELAASTALADIDSVLGMS